MAWGPFSGQSQGCEGPKRVPAVVTNRRKELRDAGTDAAVRRSTFHLTRIIIDAPNPALSVVSRRYLIGRANDPLRKLFSIRSINASR